MEIPKKVSEKIVLDNNYRKIISKDFEWKNWKISNFLIASHSWQNKAVVILPITKENKIICIKEFRYWIEDILIWFPMWWVELNLSLKENAKKELNEETGYSSENIELIWENITWNYEDTLIYNFIARNCIPWKQNLENTEFIEYFELSIEDFEQKIINWEVKCPLTLSCFCFAKMKWLV
jgi:ADP-ribose pyrophosphatase